jgi:hypothetical protein
MPLDVAIKLFRESPKCVPCGDFAGIAEAFFHFIVHDLGMTERAQEVHVERLSGSFFAFVRSQFDHEVEQAVVAQRKLSKTGGIDAHEIYFKIVTRYTRAIRTKPLAAGFEDVEADALADMYKEAFERAALRHFQEYPLDADDLSLIRMLGALYLRHDVFSPNHTGVVFAGYARGDLFPQLLAFEIDGVIAGRLKRRATETVMIDRTEVLAEIVPFAQHDMADRFLYGIDPDFEEELPGFLESAIKRLSGKAYGQKVSKPI